MARYEQNIVIDLEFTYLGPQPPTERLRHEIIQIGAVRVSPQGEIQDTFDVYVKPEYTDSVSRKVQQITGITPRDLVGKDHLEQALEALRQWVGSALTRYVAWSGSDLKQLRFETAEKGMAFPEAAGRWLDLQKIYPKFMKVGNGNMMALKVAADWYGIRVSEENLHGALYDAMLTAELLKNLITKDYLEQKACLDDVMRTSSEPDGATCSIGEMAPALLRLKEKLEQAG